MNLLKSMTNCNIITYTINNILIIVKEESELQ